MMRGGCGGWQWAPRQRKLRTAPFPSWLGSSNIHARATQAGLPVQEGVLRRIVSRAYAVIPYAGLGISTTRCAGHQQRCRGRIITLGAAPC